MKKILIGFLVLGTFLIPFSVKADCSNKEVSKLSAIASNVAATPAFDENTGKFNIVISNLRPEIYFTDIQTGREYRNINGEITLYGYAPGGSYRFKIYASIASCPGRSVLSKYATLPSYNSLYKDASCIGAESFKYCQKWVQNPYSGDEFVKQVNIYKESIQKKDESKKPEAVKGFYDYLAEFYAKYYYFILPPFIIVSIAFIAYRKKKEEFF